MGKSHPEFKSPAAGRVWSHGCWGPALCEESLGAPPAKKMKAILLLCGTVGARRVNRVQWELRVCLAGQLLQDSLGHDLGVEAVSAQGVV